MQQPDNEIFKVLDLIHSDGKAEAVLMVNDASEILAGHFPGQPVVPGACILQLVKDVLETALNSKLRLKTAQQMKFMNMVIPGDDQRLRLSISYGNLDEGSFAVQAALDNNETVCFKFQGIFVRI
jgi:3-hydroxyacyl-[acyl-carrier-protein] dehydratase